MTDGMVRIHILDSQSFKLKVEYAGCRIFRIGFHVFDCHELVIVQIGSLEIMMSSDGRALQGLNQLTLSLIIRLNHMGDSLHCLRVASKARAIGCWAGLPYPRQEVNSFIMRLLSAKQKKKPCRYCRWHLSKTACAFDQLSGCWHCHG